MITTIKEFKKINENTHVAEKELWYVKDMDDKVKNISHNPDDARNFLTKYLKNAGKIFYVTVPQSDWGNENIAVWNIDKIAKQKYT